MRQGASVTILGAKGFVPVSSGGRRVVFATDCTLTESLLPALAHFAWDCDLLLCDGQYNEDEQHARTGFGHSTWAARRSCTVSAPTADLPAPDRRAFCDPAAYADVLDMCAARWAADHQMVLGDNGGFRPGSGITREALAVLLYRYAGFMGFDTSARST